MKIGLVCPYNIYKGGGVQEIVFAMQSELAKRGHEVFIITPRPRGGDAQHSENIIFIGTGVDMKTPFNTTAQVSVNPRPDVVDQMLEAGKFDILHFHEPWISPVSRQILSRSNTKNVATFHAKLPDNTVSRTLEKAAVPYMKAILKHLHAITAVSPAAAEYVQTLTDSPVQIIPNGINIDHYQRSGSRKEKEILYIGRLENRKGVKYLIKSFAKLTESMPDATLKIAGDGPDREKLEELVKQKALTNVEFLGYISDDQKKKLLSEAALFCSPATHGESFGIVLLEAMAAGVPIVAGDNPGYSSVLKERGQISLVNPKDTKDFARRLEVLLSDEHLRQSWLKWAESYLPQFDYPKIIDSYENLYKQVLKS